MRRWGLVGLVLLLAQVAWGGTYQVTWTQPADCDEVARWELWGARGTGTLAQVGTIPATAVTCPVDPTTPLASTVTANLKRGTWSFRLRAVGVGDGETADSTVLVTRFPLTAPDLSTVTR